MSWLKSCTPGKKKKKKSYSTSQKNVLHSGNEISWDGWKYSPLLPTLVAIFTAFSISHGEPPSSFSPGFIYHHLKPELQRVSANCYCKEQTAPVTVSTACRCTVPRFMHEGVFCSPVARNPPRMVRTSCVLCAGCSAKPAANKLWGVAAVWSYVFRAFRATSNLRCFHFFPHLSAASYTRGGGLKLLRRR